MDELPVSDAQTTLGSPGGKDCKSQEGNVWRKAFSKSKKRILERNQHFFAVILTQVDWGNADVRSKFGFE